MMLKVLMKMVLMSVRERDRTIRISRDHKMLGVLKGIVLGVLKGARSNAGSVPSPSTLRQQQRRPKHKRDKQAALAPTSTPTFPLPSGPDPTGPPAQAVVPPRNSYIHGAPIPTSDDETTTTIRCVPIITTNNNDDDGENDEDNDGKQIITIVGNRPFGPAREHAGTGDAGSPPTCDQEAVTGSSCPLMARRPTSSAQLLKALVCTQDAENGTPAPAGSSREPDLNVAPGGNTRAADPSDASTLSQD